MFQKSLLKNFVKSFEVPNQNKLLKFANKSDFIAEDSNGAEFINLLANFLNRNNYKLEVKNSTDMKKADCVTYYGSYAIAILELKSSNKDISNRDIIAQAFRYKNEKPHCHIVLISNFKQLDIYSDSSDICYSINLTKLSDYATLYALLNQISLQNNEVARLKSISKTQNEITKAIYKV